MSLTFNEFISEIFEHITEDESFNIKKSEVRILPDGFCAENEKDERLIMDTNNKYHKKNTCSLIGTFLIVSKENDSFCRISMDDMYKLYQKNNIDKIYDIIKDNVSSIGNNLAGTDILKNIDNYSFVKDKLIIRPLNYDKNSHLLDNCIYNTFYDIVLVLYVVLDDSPEKGLISAKVPSEVLTAWNMSKDEVLDKAMKNTEKFAPARMFVNIEDIMNNTKKPSFDNGKFMEEDSPEYNVSENDHPFITTTKQLNGAAALFYPGIKEKLGEIMKGNYYVSFLSINEAVLQKENTIPPEKLLKMLRDNNTLFDDDDTLTNNLYFYNVCENKFEIAS